MRYSFSTVPTYRYSLVQGQREGFDRNYVEVKKIEEVGGGSVEAGAQGNRKFAWVSEIASEPERTLENFVCGFPGEARWRKLEMWDQQFWPVLFTKNIFQLF